MSIVVDSSFGLGDERWEEGLRIGHLASVGHLICGNWRVSRPQVWRCLKVDQDGLVKVRCAAVGGP